ncbi:acyltransferase domain-containing protein, partial [Acinetobacter baumannii]
MYAALFPGQGSQKVGMGKALYEAFPAARQVLDRAEATLPGLLKLMWEGPEEALTLTENQQPALLAVGYAAYQAFLAQGGQPPS